MAWAATPAVHAAGVGRSPTAGTVEPMAAPSTFERVIALEAVHNFRDLGGYEAGDGRHTRPGLLYRADSLNRLTAADVEALRPLGLRSVLDLRTPAEIAERGRFPVEAHWLAWHHLPILDVTWEHVEAESRDAATFLHDQYRDMLAYGEPVFAAAIRTLALPGALPAVFHCAAGKDRTGLLAAMVLGALGVPDDVIVADYALTAAGMERMKRWAAATNPEMYARWQSMPAVYAASEPEAMVRTLADVNAAHGSVRAYVRSLGVTAAEVAELERLLLAD
jgi:protein-tyrosine phosphatase